MSWDYDKSYYSKEDNDFPLIPEGEYQVKILDVTDKYSNTNKDMRVLKLGLLNEPGKLYYNLVFDPDNKQFTNQQLGRIFDSFSIAEGELDRVYWLDQIGAAEVVHGEYRGKLQAKVKKFLTQERQEELGFMSSAPVVVEEGTLDLDDDMPF